MHEHRILFSRIFSNLHLVVCFFSTIMHMPTKTLIRMARSISRVMARFTVEIPFWFVQYRSRSPPCRLQQPWLYQLCPRRKLRSSLGEMRKLKSKSTSTLTSSEGRSLKRWSTCSSKSTSVTSKLLMKRALSMFLTSTSKSSSSSHLFCLLILTRFSIELGLMRKLNLRIAYSAWGQTEWRLRLKSGWKLPGLNSQDLPPTRNEQVESEKSIA